MLVGLFSLRSSHSHEDVMNHNFDSSLDFGGHCFTSNIKFKREVSRNYLNFKNKVVSSFLVKKKVGLGKNSCISNFSSSAIVLNNNNDIDMYTISNELNELLNRYGLPDFTLTERVNSLSTNSDFFIFCRCILNDNLCDPYKKQLMLEYFILDYEKKFCNNILKTLEGGSDLKNHKIWATLFKDKTNKFKKRLDTIIHNYTSNNYSLYRKQRDMVNKSHFKLILALCLSIDSEALVNIILAKAIRIVNFSGGIKQTDFVSSLAHELLITFKYEIKKKDKNSEDLFVNKEARILNEIKEENRDIILDAYYNLNSFSNESNLEFGHFFYCLLLEEFNHIFIARNLYMYNENNIYILIRNEYIPILVRTMFNPIRIPMIVTPKM